MSDLDQAEKARIAAVEAEKAAAAKLNPDGTPKTAEQIKVEKLKTEADDKAAKAAETAGDPTVYAQTVADAGTLVIADEEVAKDSGHWRAQKFGNDPSNPQPVSGEATDPSKMTVQLTRKTPDLPEGTLQSTYVHPEMVGDYLRAGWNKA